jgi:3-phenylpropionate/trans-cinnamate dioxygenase ferredoxin reductase component
MSADFGHRRGRNGSRTSSNGHRAAVAIRRQYGLVVVGGGPAGHTAAREYRTAGGDGDVLLLSADDRAPYHRPPLSKDFLRGEAEADDLPLESEEFYAGAAIEVQLNTEVLGVDPAAHLVAVADGDPVGYRRCVIATGATPVVPDVPGADHPEVLLLRSYRSADRLRDRAAQAGRAIVVGSGFIGCEAAASLAMRGIEVTVLTDEELPQAGRLGADVGERIRGWLTELGVVVRAGRALTGVLDGRSVTDDRGAEVSADLVLLALGVTPNAGPFADRLALAGGRIPTDAGLRAAADDLYAAGDVALAHNAAAGRPLPVEHWGEAVAMGAVAGRNAAGGTAEWDEVPGFWSTIGPHTVKYAAWGDGFDTASLVEHADGGFTVWYRRGDAAVGVLSHRADSDYERGRELIAAAAPPPV